MVGFVLVLNYFFLYFVFCVFLFLGIFSFSLLLLLLLLLWVFLFLFCLFCLFIYLFFLLPPDVENARRFGGVPYPAWPHLCAVGREHGGREATATNGQVRPASS